MRVKSWCEERNFFVQANLIPGVLNRFEDQELRRQQDSDDETQEDSAFNRIAKTWPLQVDKFASAWNATTPGPQPGAWKTEGLTFPWDKPQAASSKAISRDVPLLSIKTKDHWSQESAFAWFYNRQVEVDGYIVKNTGPCPTITELSILFVYDICFENTIDVEQFT